MLISQCHFDGPAKANGLHEAHGPRGHCTPLPPLSVALTVRGTQISAIQKIVPLKKNK